MTARFESVEQTAIVGAATLPWDKGSGGEEADRGVDFGIAPQSPDRWVLRPSPKTTTSTAERLFDATAGAKIWTSRVAMKLERPVRDRLFRQLDNLHDEDEWFEGDQPVALESFKSFVRAILIQAIGGKPGLSLAPNGNLIAMWTSERDKLAIEFQPDNIARYLWSQSLETGPERASGITNLSRLSTLLGPIDAKFW